MFLSFLSLLILKADPLKKIDETSLALAIGLLIATIILYILEILFKILARKETIKNLKKKSIYIYRNLIIILNKIPLFSQQYTAEERNTEKYKKALSEKIKTSKRIYFRLLSAHTMFYDDKEKFILNLFNNFTENDKREKDIKIQLMSREAITFEERAHSFVRAKEKENSAFSYDEYMERCKHIETRLTEIFGREKIKFYQRKYLWRLHIFDDTIFISNYSDIPEMTEGHLAPAYSFNRECDASLFDGFLKKFESLYQRTRPPEITSPAYSH